LPPIWKVEFTLKDVAQGQISDVTETRTTSVTMSYAVRGLPRMLVDPATVEGTFKNVVDIRGRDTHRDTVTTGGPDRPLLPAHPAELDPDNPRRRRLLVGRRVTFEACKGLEGLDVWTKGSKKEWALADSFVVSQNFLWPNGTAVTTQYYRPFARWTDRLKMAASLLTHTEQEVPYDYRDPVNKKTGHSLPADGIEITGLRQISRTIDYTITRPPMKLEFLENVGPLIGQIPGFSTCGPRPEAGIMKPCESHGANYATQVATLRGRRVITARYLHGNISIRLKLGSAEVTNVVVIDENGEQHWFKPLRLRRMWFSGLRPDGSGDGNYSGHDVGGELVANQWFWDQTGITHGPNWKDMPGPLGEIRPPENWTPERFTQEFLLAVEGFPEFGFLYYVVHIDTKPRGYRVQTKWEELDADEWCKRLVTPVEEDPNDPTSAPRVRKKPWIEATEGEPWQRPPR
jgi:hypothetical protein